MWWRCARWYQIDKDTPFAKVFACSILGFCFACSVRWWSRHMSHIGIFFCLIAGLGWDWAARNMYVSLIFFLIGLSIMLLPHALDGFLERIVERQKAAYDADNTIDD